MSVPSSWTLILPCAAPSPTASSSRPKWLLTTPDGDLLVRRAAASLPASQVSRTVIVLLREMNERWGIDKALKRAFDSNVECILLDQPTSGPAETVRRAIDIAELSGPICIKDSSSHFTMHKDLPEKSFVSVADANAMPAMSRPGTKSYVRLNEQGLISSIVEKNVVSNLFSVGLYGFAETEAFVEGYDRLVAGLLSGRHIFVSHVVASLLPTHIFEPSYIDRLVDIKTGGDWAAYRANQPTIVCDIDGVVFRNQSLFFPPYWEDEVEPLEENVRHLLYLQSGGAQLLFMTSRPERFRVQTLNALKKVGFDVHALVMDCHHGPRYLVNDYAATNPHPSASAVSIKRNSADLREQLLPELRNLNQDL